MQPQLLELSIVAHCVLTEYVLLLFFASTASRIFEHVMLVRRSVLGYTIDDLSRMVSMDDGTNDVNG
jgi:hypothetical protein